MDFAILDERHGHPSEHVAGLISAGGRGAQPLVIEITNRGVDKESICRRHHEHSEQAVTGVVEEDSWFAYIAGLDEGDDWRDESVWIKPTPTWARS